MNITDPILLVLLFLFGLRGYFRGLFRESFSLLGLSIGFMVAVRYDDPLAALWSSSWKVSPILIRAAAFVALFAVVYFVFCLVGWLLHHYAKSLLLQGIDRTGGALLAIGKGTAILALALFFLLSSPFLSQQTRRKIDESYLASPLSQVGRGVYRLGKAKLLPREQTQGQAGKKSEFF